MKPPEAALRELVLQWLEKAAADLDAAEQLYTRGGPPSAWKCAIRVTHPSSSNGGEVEALDIARQVRDTILRSMKRYLQGGQN